MTNLDQTNSSKSFQDNRIDMKELLGFLWEGRKTIITLTNKVTGQEYNSDAEGDADVNDPATETKREHLKRDVLIKIKRFPSILSKSGDV